MTAVDLLKRVREVGAEVSPDGANLRIRAPQGALSGELRDQLAARKTQILDALRVERIAEASAAWSAGYQRLIEATGRWWPGGGSTLLVQHHPDLAAQVEEAERRAERVTFDYRAGRATKAEFRIAMAAWERAELTAVDAVRALQEVPRA